MVMVVFVQKLVAVSPATALWDSKVLPAMVRQPMASSVPTNQSSIVKPTLAN